MALLFLALTSAPLHADELTMERYHARACAIYQDSIRLVDYQRLGFDREAEAMKQHIEEQLYGLGEDIDMLAEESLKKPGLSQEASALIMATKRMAGI